MSIVRKNKDSQKSEATYAMFKGEDDDESSAKRLTNQMENIVDIRYGGNAVVKTALKFEWKHLILERPLNFSVINNLNISITCLSYWFFDLDLFFNPQGV